MPTVVVPFRGPEGKSRLGELRLELRTSLAHAMLGDVVEACLQVGPTFVVAPDHPPAEGATLVPDPGGGQGAAVRAGLDAAAATGAGAPFLVVNGDLPCVRARDLLALVGALPANGLAVAPARDGTTNALVLASPGLFAPVYGPGSAERFAALAPSRIVDAPNLADDVDTLADLERVRELLGPRTKRLLARLRLEEAA